MERIIPVEDCLASPEAKRREKEEPPYIAASGEGSPAQRPAEARCAGSAVSPPRVSWTYPLFSHMATAHGLCLLESELMEIVAAVREMEQANSPS